LHALIRDAVAAASLGAVERAVGFTRDSRNRGNIVAGKGAPAGAK
jgi:hypothetical protein